VAAIAMPAFAGFQVFIAAGKNQKEILMLK